MSTELPLVTVVVASANYPVTAQVIEGSAPAGYAFINMSLTETVFFTFNRTGAQTVDEGVLPPGAGLPVSYASTKQSVWFRLASGSQAAIVYAMAAA